MLKTHEICPLDLDYRIIEKEVEKLNAENLAKLKVNVNSYLKVRTSITSGTTVNKKTIRGKETIYDTLVPHSDRVLRHELTLA